MATRRTRTTRFVAAAALLALTATACGDTGSEGTTTGDSTTTTGGTPTEAATLVFGTSADPIVLDGILVSDGESLRAIDQMFEGLVGLKAGGTEIEPLLATDWTASDDGLAWTFTLRDGVTFHDGETFDAAAVCANFDRWYNFTDSFQNESATYYWQTTMGGFADGGGPAAEDSLYKDCTVNDDGTVTLGLLKPSASFLSALALTNFTFASPKALAEFGADEGEVDADGVFRPTGTYGTEHPTGTGPFMFSEWVIGEKLVMTKNPDYWGEFPGNIETLIFRPIADGPSRLQALQSGEIMGYDLVSPEDFATIEADSDLQLLSRPAFNVGYVGIDQSNDPILQDVEVRKAIAHALNRDAVVDGLYAGQGEVARNFMPPELFGATDDVTTYDYDPEMSKKLLTDAGYTLPVKVIFGYPTDVSRPYMPDPQANAEAFVADLNAAGFEVELRSAPWSPDYLGRSSEGEYGLYLLGWTGDFGDPDNFVGVFFQGPNQGRWGFDNPELHALLNEAEAEADVAARTKLYEQANQMIADFVPGVPYVHTKPALAFRANVTGYVPSPVSLEPFTLVTVN